jgi:NAD(P)H-hydrate epimerase
MDCFSPLIADTAGLDAAAAHKYGIPSLTLMERASEALTTTAMTLLASVPGECSAHKILLLCGPGNNGGDGFVLARLLGQQLPQAMVTVCVAQRRDPTDASSDAAINEARIQRLPIQWLENPSEDSMEQVLSEACLVVDAIFGVGLNRELDKPYGAWVHAMNASGKPVLSVDIPSGIDAITGKAMGSFAQAAYTVTFGTAKPGHWLGGGKIARGQLTVADIGFPVELLATYPTSYQLLTQEFALQHWPWPTPSAARPSRPLHRPATAPRP